MNTHTHTVVYIDSVPHTPSCCPKYSTRAPHVDSSALLDKKYPKCPSVLGNYGAFLKSKYQGRGVRKYGPMDFVGLGVFMGFVEKRTLVKHTWIVPTHLADSTGECGWGGG